MYGERSAALTDAIEKHLPHCSFVAPLGGFFVWLQLPAGRTAATTQEVAAKLGVNFQAGTRFGTGAALSQYVRLSFAYYEHADLTEGVKRLARALR